MFGYLKNKYKSLIVKHATGLMMSDFDTSGNGRRVANWSVSNRGPNSLIFSNLRKLIGHSRSLGRTNPTAVSIKENVVAGVVGTGIRPLSLHPDRKIRTLQRDAFDSFADNCDVEGMQNFYGMMTVAAHEFVEAGSCFGRFRERQSADGFNIPLQLQLLEPEQLNTSLQSHKKNKVVNGIEYDRIGRRLAYHMYQGHPGENMGYDGLRTVRISAKNMIHVFRPTRAGQNQGLPVFTQILLKLHDMEETDDSALLSQKLANLFGVYFEDLNADDPGLKLPGQIDNGDGTAVAKLEPGGAQILKAGLKPHTTTPPNVSVQYGEFYKAQMRMVSSAAFSLYHQTTGDLSNINFSSVRAGIIDLKRKIEGIQHNVFVFQFCRPTWRRVMDSAVLNGIIDLPGYIENPWPYLRVKWVPQGREWVDPLKDVNANILQVDNLMKSLSECIRERGQDPDLLLEEIAEEKKYLEELGLSKTEVMQKINPQDETLEEEEKEDAAEKESDALAA